MISYPLPDFVANIFQTVKKRGFEIYLVGGSVRDLIMNRKTTNWDFTTNARTENILKIFPDAFYDNAFGTVGIPHDKEVIEITTYRSDHGYTDKRHPDKVVWGKNLKDDLSRRDFTIGAIAYDGDQIIDPFGGQKDIEAKIIRTVGDPHLRFSEDALRLMRAIRIAAELGFMIEEKTLEAVKTHAKLIHNVSKERIREELLKLLKSDYASDGIMLLRSSGILMEILPELEACFGVEQKSPKRHHIYDVGTHLVMSLKHCRSKDPIVRFATLIHDIGKAVVFNKQEDGVITFYNHEVVGTSIARKILARLKFSKKDSEKILTLVRWHQFTVDEMQTDKAIRRFIRHIGLVNIEDMFSLRTADRLGGGALETSWRLDVFRKRLVEVQKQPFTVLDLKINGYDVMKTLGIDPGPKVGEILNLLFKEVEDNPAKNTREALIARLTQIKEAVSFA